MEFKYYFSEVLNFIVEFGDAWSMPLVAVILAITAWKFRDVLESLLSRLGKIKWAKVKWSLSRIASCVKQESSLTMPQTLVQALMKAHWT